MTTRAEFLSDIHAPLQNPTAGQTSPTKSIYRLRWRELTEWDFRGEAQAYWDDLAASEKNEVFGDIPTNYWTIILGQLRQLPFQREPQLSTPFATLYAIPHNRATDGAADDHALLSTGYPDSAVGQPDGSFVIDERLVGIAEIKTFWNITEQSIDEVLQDTAPHDGDHHGRLAVEQAYGYMFHNAVVYGLITTINAFTFLCRSNGGILKMTPLIPANTAQTPTILQMLYYMSHLCAMTPALKEKHPDGRVVRPMWAGRDSSAAPKVPAPAFKSPKTTLGPTPNLGPPRRSPRHQNIDEPTTPPADVNADDDFHLVIDIHAPGTYLGGKGYSGVLQSGQSVFAKLWDGWKYSGKEAEKEVGIYMALQDLWGNMVPKLLTHGGWGFCHVILLELVVGTMLSNVTVTTAIEKNVIAVFMTLHERGIYHGDVRGPNILVRGDDSVVVLDFERSCANADRMMLLEEEDEVRHMLLAMKNRTRGH